MQSDIKAIYHITSLRTGVPTEVYKDLGNFVFANTRETLNAPPKLITKLRGIGTWHLRRKRIHIYVEKLIPESTTLTPEKIALFEIFKLRIEDYHQYVALKAEIRKLRNAVQPLLSAVNGQTEGDPSSQTDTEKPSGSGASHAA
jgi:hypothetical protein